MGVDGVREGAAVGSRFERNLRESAEKDAICWYMLSTFISQATAQPCLFYYFTTASYSSDLRVWSNINA